MVSYPAAGSLTRGRAQERPLLERYINIIGPMIMILALCLLMVILEPRFFRVSNIMIIMQDAAIYMALGMAMTIVISGRGIDLSIGSVAALAGVVMAMMIKDFGMGPYAGMLIAVLVGLACGATNGFIITRLQVPDLITTLATDLVFRGIALVLAAGTVLARFPDIIPFLGRGRLLEIIPVAMVIGLLALAIGHIIYRYTPLGRYAIAIGGNREAAELTGINVDRHKLYHYMLMGAMAGIAGVMLTGRLNAIQATSGQGLALHTIAAVVVGGTSLFGGRGSMLGTLVGVLLLSMVTNSLVMLRMDFFWQQVASGIIIVASVAFYAHLQQQGSGVSGGLTKTFQNMSRRRR